MWNLQQLLRDSLECHSLLAYFSTRQTDGNIGICRLVMEEVRERRIKIETANGDLSRERPEAKI